VNITNIDDKIIAALNQQVDLPKTRKKLSFKDLDDLDALHLDSVL
jgi:cysteinyl-tRNA synthetase